MKLDARGVGAFLRDPGACRVVLLYGEDTGLIRERAQGLIRLVAGSLDDPFRVADLAREDIARLPDEAASLSLIGGRRAVRVRDATDAATEPVKAVLAGPAPALVVLESPACPPARACAPWSKRQRTGRPSAATPTRAAASLRRSAPPSPRQA